MLQATGASLLRLSASPPRAMLLMYFCSQQLGRELAVDTSPLVQQRTVRTHYGLRERVSCVCAPLCVKAIRVRDTAINNEVMLSYYLNIYILKTLF